MLQRARRALCALAAALMIFAAGARGGARAETISRDITLDALGLTYHYFAQNDPRWERLVYRLDAKGNALNSVGNGGCQYIAYVTAFDMMGFGAYYASDAQFVERFLDRALPPDRSEPYQIEFLIKRLSAITGLAVDYRYQYLGYALEETLAVLKTLQVGAYAMPFISDIYNTGGRASHGKGSAITSTGHYATVIGHTLDAAGEVEYLYISDPMYRPDYESYLESYQKSQEKLEKNQRRTYEKRHGYTPQEAFDIVVPGVLRVTAAQFADYFNYNQGSLLVWGENITRLEAE